MSDAIIQVRGLGKCYRIGEKRGGYKTIRESFTDLLLLPFRKAKDQASAAPAGGNGQDTFWALKDVSFEVKAGEVVGIIGRNGAGKSTLLKVLSRITAPTEGEIEIAGRVGSLLEVGTGFHPELTGRENIYLNGAILGMTRGEIARKFDEIVAFAETEKFLDTPVKFYSSGMYTRLAFAVAAHLEPEILIVDEVLAVGDTEFQKKCMGKMSEVAGEGRTVLFVSHNLSAVVTLCSRVLVLQKGALIFDGDTAAGIEGYAGTRAARNTILSHGEAHSQALTVEAVTANSSGADELELDFQTSEILIDVEGTVRDPGPVDLEGELLDRNGLLLGHFCPSRQSGRTEYVSRGPFKLRTTVYLPTLNKGEYYLTFWLAHPNVAGHYIFQRGLRISARGQPLANGDVFEGSSKGPLLIRGETKLLSEADASVPGVENDFP